MRILIIYLMTVLAALSSGADTSGAESAHASIGSHLFGHGSTEKLKEKIPVQLGASELEMLRQDEDKLNLYCLTRSYPGIKGIEERGGKKWLVTEDGRDILYSGNVAALREGYDGEDITVAESMELPYTLEPGRPDLPQGFSPGRKRSKPLLEWLYGNSKESVSKGLGTAKFMGKYISLRQGPLSALKNAIPELNRLAAHNPELKIYLEPSGGFNWRKIACENRLSPHAYGIALDIGVRVSPYWRWAKITPHPKQKTYPTGIVRIFEDNGFIWGGKWHEYDLMHFEYRPELICKARIKAMLEEANQRD